VDLNLSNCEWIIPIAKGDGNACFPKSLESFRGMHSPREWLENIGVRNAAAASTDRKGHLWLVRVMPRWSRVMPGGLVSHVLNRSVADLALLREAGGLRGLRADSDVHRQKPALRERPVAKPAGRRSGMVAYPTARRSPVEADGESEKRAASPFPCPAARTLDDHGGTGGLAVEAVVCGAGRPSPSRLSVILPRRRGGGKHFFASRVPESDPIRASHRRDDAVSREEPHVFLRAVPLMDNRCPTRA
jgi:hypothetical protein